MIGFKCGLLTVYEFSHSGFKGVKFWKSRCVCGRTRVISTGELNRKRTKISSCGCYRPHEDLSGLKFGNLIVLKESTFKKSRAYFLCKCVCGKEKVVSGESLKRGSTKSCGCLSEFGSLLFMQKVKTRLLDNLINTKGCMEWMGKLDKDGYGSMNLTGIKTQRAHRVSWFIHKGEIQKDKCVLHKCDNKKCCNPDHLYLGTPKDNAKDALERGQFPTGPNKKKGRPGERHSNSKLTEKQVLDMRNMYKPRIFGYHKISKLFGVNKTTAKRAIQGETWSCV